MHKFIVHCKIGTPPNRPIKTCKVVVITEELHGHAFSASAASAITRKLDAELAAFAGRRLEEAYPYLILDARYERVREAGVIASQAVLIAIGIDLEGRRQVVAVELAEARQDLARWLAKWQAKYPKLCDWVEANIEETLACYRLPLQHHKHMKSTNLLERLNQEIKRRTHVVRIFRNAESCLRLVRALAVKIHEGWLEVSRYLNMEHLKEHKKGGPAGPRRLTAARRGQRCAITGAPRRPPPPRMPRPFC